VTATPDSRPLLSRPLVEARSEGREGRALARDLRTLVRFVSVYCRSRHRGRLRRPVELRGAHPALAQRRAVRLCAECGKLLAHAVVKRVRCPFEPKPACRKCPTHCYAPSYRAMIREVMRYSGWRLVLRGRVDYLLHLLG